MVLRSTAKGWGPVARAFHWGMLLLFIGIHNAWDAVSYHVFVNLSGARRESSDKESRRDEAAGG